MNNSIDIKESKFLDQILVSMRSAGRNEIEIVEYLNKLRLRSHFYGYGNNIVNKIVLDSPNCELEFNNLVWQGTYSKQIRLFRRDKTTMISYPAINNGNNLVYNPTGAQTNVITVEQFWSLGSIDSWTRRPEHAKLLEMLRSIYLAGLLKFKRSIVIDIKRNLSTDVVHEFLQVKKVNKTQAIMNISMAAGALLSKIENYQKNIATVESAPEAQKLYAEAESAMIKLKMAHDRNVRNLNKTKISKHIQKIIET